MPLIRVLSAGAAQALLQGLSARLEEAAGATLDVSFGPAGALIAKLRAGETPDVVILTSEGVADLARDGLLDGASSRDLGLVRTGIAVRAGDPLPPIADAAELRSAILAADAIHVPNPEIATSGIHFARVLEKLGIKDEVWPRLKASPNGASAMSALAKSDAKRPIGCTQASEMLHEPGVALVGPLPQGFELASTYTAAVSATASSPDAAKAFVALLTGSGTADIRTRWGLTPN